MTWLIPFLLTVIILALSLLLISKLPLGIEVDSLNIAFLAGLVLGLLNALIRPLLEPVFGATIINILTLGLASILLNALIFGLAAKLVTGFRLRWGILSALLGAFALSIVYSVLSNILMRLGLMTVG
ncbi:MULTISPECIES: phage holin family protein [unclassified Leptolyngbya]|uniref:phage holin family protein n=1 Tax=unclassified Leptolyngbya TaxID=2650499 RepID=UPI001688BA9A|nr:MULTISPECIES: phage holin family protein [unclassified Leptolyngbya]MBD1911848.1 phage holin family protein [Leptolyngbya sp. FACHB-8]MBD2157471.1 phage holin family protein [Leptolyngbya sp. FACHB-16]